MNKLFLLMIMMGSAAAGAMDIHEAAKSGNLARLELLLADPDNIYARDCEWLTPLHWAVIRKQEAAVKLILQHDIDVNVYDCGHLTPIFYADGHGAIISMLHERGAKGAPCDEFNSAELRQAAFNGTTESMSLQLNHAVDVNYDAVCDGFFHGTALCRAVTSPFPMALEKVRLLLAHGAAVNQRTEKGGTPLCGAVRSDLEESAREEVVQLLLQHGADVNLKTKHPISSILRSPKRYIRYAPLHCAVACKHLGIIRVLLEHGADIYQKDRDGQTPLDYAKSDGDPEVIRLLHVWPTYTQNRKDARLALCAARHQRLGMHSPARNLSLPLINKIVSYTAVRDFNFPMPPKPTLYQRMVAATKRLLNNRRFQIGAATTALASAGFAAWRLLRRAC